MKPHPKSQPRVPLQKRSIARYNMLLDATEQLLRESDPDAFGLYQIAECSGIPAASVYHFFPTKEAAFTALAQRHIEGMLAISAIPFKASRLTSWQDLMRIEHERGREYYELHPDVMKLFYGGSSSFEGKKLDVCFRRNFASVAYNRYNSVFHMPHIADSAVKFYISISLMDTIWELSFLSEGCITDDYAEEAFVACLSYGRSFLPERIQVREHVKALAEADQTICVPITGEPGVPGDPERAQVDHVDR